jgi:hypothetical protein
MRRYGSIIRILEECPFKRHRPRTPGNADIGQSLLDANRASRPFHDEHEVEISVANFADPPAVRSPAE